MWPSNISEYFLWIILVREDIYIGASLFILIWLLEKYIHLIGYRASLWQERWGALFYSQTSNFYVEEYKGLWRKNFPIIPLAGWKCNIKFVPYLQDYWSICNYGNLPVQLYRYVHWYLFLLFILISLIGVICLFLFLNFLILLGQTCPFHWYHGKKIKLHNYSPSIGTYRKQIQFKVTSDGSIITKRIG